MAAGVRSGAVIFSRGPFGIYGLGHIEVSEQGIAVRWSGLVRVRPKSSGWGEIQSVRMRGSKVSVKRIGQVIPTTALVFHQTRILEALQRFAPPQKLEV